MSRYFIVQEPAMLDALAVFDDTCKRVREACADFLRDVWGGEPRVVYSGANGRRIIGLADPRTFDPPKPLTKGWRKSKHANGMVEPSSKENEDLLATLSEPYEQSVIPEVLKRIAAQDPYNASRLETCGPESLWTGTTNGNHYMYWSRVYHLPIKGIWVIAVPDPTLKFPSVEGLLEIYEYELQAWLEEEKKERKVQKEACECLTSSRR